MNVKVIVHAAEELKADLLNPDSEPATPQNLADAIRARFNRSGGVELELPARDEMVRDPPHSTSGGARRQRRHCSPLSHGCSVR